MVAAVTKPEFGVPDEDSPEWPQADFARAKPAREILAKAGTNENREGSRVAAEATKRQMKQPGLDDGHRDGDGEIHRKRSDTLVRTLRKEYGPEVAKGCRSDARLGTVLDKEGLSSLSELLKKKSCSTPPRPAPPRH